MERVKIEFLSGLITVTATPETAEKICSKIATDLSVKLMEESNNNKEAAQNQLLKTFMEGMS